MQERKQVIHQRVTSLIESLIELEQKALGGSLADALERLVLRGSDSEPAKELMFQEARKDPQFGRLIEIAAQRGESKKRK